MLFAENMRARQCPETNTLANGAGATMQAGTGAAPPVQSRMRSRPPCEKPSIVRNLPRKTSRAHAALKGTMWPFEVQPLALAGADRPKS